MTVHRLVPRFPEPVIDKVPRSVSVFSIIVLGVFAWTLLVAAGYALCEFLTWLFGGP